LIDVRTPAEFEEVHASVARSMPLERLDAEAVRRICADHAGPIYVICRSGSRGKQACEKLLAAGLANVVNVEGGTLAWEQAGLPVTRGRKAMSLERQMRILMGSFVVVGLGLGMFVHEAFYGLSLFAGVGLIFAGITDICPLSRVMARMPWNQRGATCNR
jgi:rhodanese-related sulfurtransferase